jgi:hypothetical protein
VKKRAASCVMLCLALACLLSACAKDVEEGVVTERTGPAMTAPEAHFARPSFAPNGEAGSSSGHF